MRVFPVTAEVLIGQSYYLRFDPKLWAAMQPYPPLGALYAASYLQPRRTRAGRIRMGRLNSRAVFVKSRPQCACGSSYLAR